MGEVVPGRRLLCRCAASLIATNDGDPWISLAVKSDRSDVQTVVGQEAASLLTAAVRLLLCLSLWILHLYNTPEHR